LVILWDSEYFQRGWCVYELASFVALNPNGRIITLPLKASAGKVALNLAYFVGHAIVLMWPFVFDCSFLVAIVTAAFLSGVLVMASFDWYQRDVVALQSQFDEFDFNETKITVESDREAIVESIKEMYPNGGVAEFNRIVRTKVKQVMLNEFCKQRCGISYRHALIAAFPAFCGGLACLSSYRHTPTPFQLCVLVFNVTFTFAVHPLVLALCWSLLQRGTGTQDAGHKIRLRRYISGAAVVSMLMVLSFTIVLYLPGAVATGQLRIPSHSETSQAMLGNPWSAVAISCVVGFAYWPVCIWFFWPRNAKKHLESNV